MRSRDGSCYLTCAICSIILFSPLVLDAKEFLISYRYVVKDATLYNDSLYISNAMTKCSGEPEQSLVLEAFGEKNLKLTISKNSHEFLNYLHKLGLQVEHKDITINAQHSSTTILTLKTTCFKVDFNDNLVRIAPLK